MNLVLTGFGPFLSNDINPSGEVAASLGGNVLEVSYAQADRFIAETDASVLLCLGLSAKTENPRIEVRAWNQIHRHTPDVAGTIPEKETIEGEEKARATTFDIPELFAAMTKQGFPCPLSDDPGTYLCNYLYYRALGKTKGKALFLHLPPYGETWTKQRLTAFVDAVRSWIDTQK